MPVSNGIFHYVLEQCSDLNSISVPTYGTAVPGSLPIATYSTVSRTPGTNATWQCLDPSEFVLIGSSSIRSPRCLLNSSWDNGEVPMCFYLPPEALRILASY